jgi:hypothetical protein
LRHLFQFLNSGTVFSNPKKALALFFLLTPKNIFNISIICGSNFFLNMILFSGISRQEDKQTPFGKIQFKNKKARQKQTGSKITSY